MGEPRNPSDRDPRGTAIVAVLGVVMLVVLRDDFKPNVWPWLWLVLGLFVLVRLWGAWRRSWWDPWRCHAERVSIG